MAGDPRRPLIGVTASTGRGRVPTGLIRFALWRAGARSGVLTAGDPADASGLDGLVVGGGDDIGLEVSEEAITLATRTDPERDRLERRLLDHAAARGLPVLGICRGAQMINLARGGTLHQDIYTSFEGLPRLRTVLPRKTVTIAPDSLLGRLLGVASTRVNALHHQSVERPGERLRLVAHDRFGIVQGLEDPGEAFVLGVQWHPEMLLSRGNQQHLFDGLVAAARCDAATPKEAAAHVAD